MGLKKDLEISDPLMAIKHYGLELQLNLRCVRVFRLFSRTDGICKAYALRGEVIAALNIDLTFSGSADVSANVTEPNAAEMFEAEMRLMCHGPHQEDELTPNISMVINKTSTAVSDFKFKFH